MAIELGGEITLEGFDDIDAGELIVVKKLVGRYARKMSENISDYKGLIVELKNPGKDIFELISQLDAGKKNFKAEVQNENLFIGLDESLQKLMSQV